MFLILQEWESIWELGALIVSLVVHIKHILEDFAPNWMEL